ncbi:site-specific DNA-methyltransferase [Methylocaldum szegediense]|uniref:Adenine-specific DNA-methyltransferase n=1 Tax=Methylocaldum szegediense TaxID=73780 RepID=A0ABN8X8B1_9GAMM|nr:site-specific DNA-methyltransferase [Methylocaldum szegediense]CAI8859170.1 adenine-specific DNA-methyltransferase [Methylocaldum szegediense]
MSAPYEQNQNPADKLRKIKELILALVPSDSSPIGNTTLRRELEARLAADGMSLSEEDYWQAHSALVAQGLLVKGQGRGGSVRLPSQALKDPAGGMEHASFTLAAEEPSAQDASDQPSKQTKSRNTQAASRQKTGGDEAQILSYRHTDKRVNNPEVGMVNPKTDPDAGKTRWAYDPHLDPALQFDPQRSRIEKLIDDALASGDTEQMKAALEELKRLQSPYLNWAGKAERTSFEVDTVSLHVHERIDPASILSAVRKAMKGEGRSRGMEKALQPGLFDAPFENLPLRDAIDFYRHEKGWANRLIAGDSLLVMNSLLQKESMAGKVQMIYIDPPYGIKYGSNFQPFVNKRDVKDRRDEDLTQEPEMIKAFRDTWELGIHSYLTYLRDRLLLARELLHESGSLFVQISDENLHLVRNLLDDVFGSQNFVRILAFRKTGAQPSDIPAANYDFIIWYGKHLPSIKTKKLFTSKETSGSFVGQSLWIQDQNYARRPARRDEKKDFPYIDGLRFFVAKAAEGAGTSGNTDPIHLFGLIAKPGSKKHWSTTTTGLDRLTKSNRMVPSGSTARFVWFFDDFPLSSYGTVWDDTVRSGFGDQQVYIVETNSLVIERCLLMTTDPGDLVLDPTCGSGTTAYVAEKWGRRWITCDTSRVAITLAKQRLMTANYDYYELKYPHEGLKGGFIYKTVPHVTLKSIANNPEIDEIYERMHPAIEKALAELNATLRASPPKPFTVTEGGRKGKKVDFSFPASQKEKLPSGEEVMAGVLLEWEVPFDFPEDWPNAARKPFEAFHAARQAMQKRMDDSIAAHADQEILYDQPQVAKNKLRITGPFTVEAVPFPTVKSLDEAAGPDEADASIARTGESGRQHQWRDELLKTGIRGRGGQVLKFADLEPLPSAHSIRHLHAVGHLDTGERVVVSFGPEHAALEQRQVAQALTEAEKLRPQPAFIVFCAFTFDPEAAKDIDETRWPGVTLLKAQMNTDLLTEDLKKARASNQSFWLMGQPDVEVRKRKDGQYEVEVHGFDYFDTVKGELVSGGKSKIAMWLLDTDYDERSLFPRQVFFPMAGKGEGWEKLKKNIRAELDESRLQSFHGTVSLPFEAGEHRKIAVKIVDDRGIESLKVINLD